VDGGGVSKKVKTPPPPTPGKRFLEGGLYNLEDIMAHQAESCPAKERTIEFDLGTFEGFNFRTQSAIERVLTAVEVVAWDHDRNGEAEFWPAGDRAEVALLFKSKCAVTASELVDVDRLLNELGGDCSGNFLRIHYAINVSGVDLSALSAEMVEDQFLHVFIGTSFIDLRREAACELFELYYPEEYRMWEQSTCDGLIFDCDRFLSSPAMFVDEVTLGDQKALLIAPC